MADQKHYDPNQGYENPGSAQQFQPNPYQNPPPNVAYQGYPPTYNNGPQPAVVIIQGGPNHHCPVCLTITPSRIEYQAGDKTWGWCLILCFTVGCCCIPFFVDSCKDQVYYCRRCNVIKYQQKKKLC